MQDRSAQAEAFCDLFQFEAQAATRIIFLGAVTKFNLIKFNEKLYFMLRISGVNLPDNKKIGVSLTYIYGVGPSIAAKTLAELKISPEKRTKELTDTEQNEIRNYVEKKYKVEGEAAMFVYVSVTS